MYQGTKYMLSAPDSCGNQIFGKTSRRQSQRNVAKERFYVRAVLRMETVMIERNVGDARFPRQTHFSVWFARALIFLRIMDRRGATASEGHSDIVCPE